MRNSGEKPKYSVLIVEDEGILSMDIRFRLEDMGYLVVGIADTGEKAIELALSEKPDVVLMDMRLKSSMTGMEAAAYIKSKSTIPVIFVTAYTDQETMKLVNSQPDSFLIRKPFNSITLKDILAKVLENHSPD